MLTDADHEMIRRLARRRCSRAPRSPAWDADDLEQEAVLRVLAIRAAGKPGRMVPKAALNAMKTLAGRELAERAKAGGLAASGLVERRGRSILSRDEVADLAAALEVIPADQASAVVRRHMLGLSGEEIAAANGICRYKAFELIAEGLAALREALGESYLDDFGRGVAKRGHRYAWELAGVSRARPAGAKRAYDPEREREGRARSLARKAERLKVGLKHGGEAAS